MQTSRHTEYVSRGTRAPRRLCGPVAGSHVAQHRAVPTIDTAWTRTRRVSRLRAPSICDGKALATSRAVRGAVTLTDLGSSGRLVVAPEAFDVFREIACAACLAYLREHLAAGSGDGPDIMGRNRIPAAPLRGDRLDRRPFGLRASRGAALTFRAALPLCCGSQHLRSRRLDGHRRGPVAVSLVVVRATARRYSAR